MKIRNGFISNSSSSSFIVSLKDISVNELNKIMEYSDSSDAELRDTWHITVDASAGILRGFTSMDNDDFDSYLKNNNIDTSKFKREND